MYWDTVSYHDYTILRYSVSGVSHITTSQQNISHVTSNKRKVFPENVLVENVSTEEENSEKAFLGAVESSWYTDSV